MHLFYSHADSELKTLGFALLTFESIFAFSAIFTYSGLAVRIASLIIIALDRCDCIRLLYNHFIRLLHIDRDPAFTPHATPLLDSNTKILSF